jgi:energy-coupling factor transporter transmembrane protein EcfT
VQTALEKETIHFTELSTGAFSRFIFSLSIALAAVATKNPGYLILLLAFSILAILSWGGHLHDIIKIIRYSLLLSIFIFLLHLFLHSGQPLIKFWFLSATTDGARTGLLYALKLLVFAYAAGIIFIVVDPFDLISPLERLARHIGPLGQPLGALTLSFFLALRFLPELSNQSRLTLLAFKTRGLDFKGGLSHKARVASLLIAPMFVNGFKRAELAAAALNIKGYATRYSNAVFNPIKISIGSILTFSISIIILVAGWRI